VVHHSGIIFVKQRNKTVIKNEVVMGLRELFNQDAGFHMLNETLPFPMF
jgi:hypothetical protein